MNAVVDTNILIDYLNGSAKARTELRHFQQVSISLITWMEVLVGATETVEETSIRGFLTQFDVVPVDRGVAERAIDIRRRTRLRLADAIVWATAQHLGLVLVTRNTRDFPTTDPGIRIPYKL